MTDWLTTHASPCNATVRAGVSTATCASLAAGRQTTTCQCNETEDDKLTGVDWSQKFGYDADGLLLYDGTRVLIAQSDMGEETKTRVCGLGLTRTHVQLMMEQEEHLFLPLGTDTESPAIPSRFLDGQGSTRTLTDETGAVVATYAYDSYGNLVTSTGAASTAYRYIGNQRYRAEDDLGLIWIGCRHYDPAVGRWTTEDTWLGDPLVPESLNRYVYCGGDPVNRTDASGRCWRCVVGAVLTIGGFVVFFCGMSSENPVAVAIGAVGFVVGVACLIWGISTHLENIDIPLYPDEALDPWE